MPRSDQGEASQWHKRVSSGLSKITPNFTTAKRRSYPYLLTLPIPGIQLSETAMRLLMVLFLFEALVAVQVCTGQQLRLRQIGPEFRVPEPYVPRNHFCDQLSEMIIPSIIWAQRCGIVQSLDVLKNRRPNYVLDYLQGATTEHPWPSWSWDRRRKRDAFPKGHRVSILVSKLRRY